MRRPPSISLAGLAALPDPMAQKRMEIFDGLPPDLRGYANEKGLKQALDKKLQQVMR